jgi:hypothetical protein
MPVSAVLFLAKIATIIAQLSFPSEIRVLTN